jgi:hypothetical protein
VKTRSNTILLLNLSEAETQLVKRLPSPFEIETVSLSVGTIRNFIKTFPEKKICLIIYHIEENRKRQYRAIQLIRDLVGAFVPFLLLVPTQKSGKIKKYIRAGADDFMGLPLNENRFSVSFPVLLEMGRAITRQPMAKPLIDDGKTATRWADLGRVVNYIQAGLSYFAPKLLMQKKRSEHISAKWQKVKKLGHGGFGIVWLVKEIHSGRLAVAKVPHSPQMNIRVLRTAAILKRLEHHPNIVHLLEIVKDNGKFILIQEYVEGSTLQQILEHPISPLDKEIYLLQLLSVISYSHKHKIIHRDIKPENIIISKTGQLKLLDFGIARDLSWQVAGGSSEGTVNFMPPEQFEGQSCIASDVWAIGVILYIFATNTVPYVQQNDQYPMDIETTVESRAPSKINPLVPPGLERIIMTCLQKDLDIRYNNATNLLDDLVTTFPAFGRGESATTPIGCGLMKTPRRHRLQADWREKETGGAFGIMPAHA